MGVTAGSRFNAARRMQSIDRSFNYMLSAVSVAVIALTVLPFIYDLEEPNRQLVGLFTIAASIAILVLTNIKYGNRDLVVAEQLHRCALEINEVGRRIDAEPDGEKQNLFRQYSDEYSAILQKYSVNHDKIDFIEHKVYRSDEYIDEYAGFSGFGKYWFQTCQIFWWHNYVWIVGLPVLLVCALVVLRVVGITF